MWTKVVEFTVKGTPRTAGSKKAVPNRKYVSEAVTPKVRRTFLVDDSGSKGKTWRKTVARTAYAALPPGFKLLDCPIDLHLQIRVVRPAGHMGTGRNAGTLRPSAPIFPMWKPDQTKMLRAIEDALTGVVWRDDSRIVQGVQSKRYADAEPEGVDVTVYAWLEAARP